MTSAVQEEVITPQQTRVLSKAECQVEMMRIEKENNYLLSEVGQLTRRFEAEQRIARCLSMSSIVPDMYMSRDGSDITAISNCYIALQMAHRLSCDVMAVMQNMYVIHGMPCFYAKFIIARINESGKFSLLRYEFNEYDKNAPEYGCRVVAYEKADTEYKNPLYGEWITNAMVKAEGWDKNSKWRSPNMREQMFRYRAASFWQRVYCPELTMGYISREEVEDIPYREADSTKTATKDTLSKIAELAMADQMKDVATQEEEATQGELF